MRSRRVAGADRLGAVGGVLVATAGAAAGAAGAVLLRRLPRGVPLPVWLGACLVAVVWAAVAIRADGLPLWWWPVPLLVGWAGVLLAAADVVARRLPDALTVSGYPVVAVLLTVAAAGAGDGGLLVRAAAGALLWSGGYALVRLIWPGSLGGGDVKLAASLGALAAAGSWSGLLLAVLAAAVLTALVAGPARLLGHRDVPHGPAMLLAAWVVVLQPPG